MPAASDGLVPKRQNGTSLLHHRSADIRLSLHDEPAAYADLSPVIVMPTVAKRMPCGSSSGSDAFVFTQLDAHW